MGIKTEKGRKFRKRVKEKRSRYTQWRNRNLCHI